MSTIPKKIEFLDTGKINFALPSDARDYMLESAEKIEHNLGRFTRAKRKISKIFQSKKTAEKNSLTQENQQLYYDFNKLYEFFDSCTKGKKIEVAKKNLESKGINLDSQKLSQKAAAIINNIKDNAEIKKKIKKITDNSLQGKNYLSIINNIINLTSNAIKQWELPSQDNPKKNNTILGIIKDDFKGYCNAMITKLSKGGNINDVMDHAIVKNMLKTSKKHQKNLKKLFYDLEKYISKNKIIENGYKKYPKEVKALDETRTKIRETIGKSDKILSKADDIIYYGETLKDVGTNANFEQGINRFISPLIESVKIYNDSVDKTKIDLENKNSNSADIMKQLEQYLNNILVVKGSTNEFTKFVKIETSKTRDEKTTQKRLKKYTNDIEKIRRNLEKVNEQIFDACKDTLLSSSSSKNLNENIDFDKSLKGLGRDVVTVITAILGNILKNLVYYLPLINSLSVILKDDKK